jgi:hypothetical protein
MLVLAQNLAEYGGLGSGIGGAFSAAAETVSSSVSEHTVLWIVGACVVAFFLFKRR